MTKKDWEVVHYGPTRWEGPAEKKHYSRHASIEAANTHARKLAHGSLPKEPGWNVEHNNSADDPDDPMHYYVHVNNKAQRLGDSVAVQRVGSQEKFEKDVDEGRAQLDPEIMRPLVEVAKKHFAFKKDN